MCYIAASKLKLHPDKTEFIIFGTPDQQDSLSPFFPVTISGSLLHPSDKPRSNLWLRLFILKTDKLHQKILLFSNGYSKNDIITGIDK